MGDYSRTYGYVRVSTVDQNVARQLVKMRELGVDEVFVDKASGKDMCRPEWLRLMRRVQRGDAIVVDSLDRLGRSYDDVTSEWRRLTREVGVDIRCLDLEFMDSASWRAMGDVGKVMEDTILNLLAYVAETERKKMLQRQREGIEQARLAGKYVGRRPIDVDEADLRLLVQMERTGEITAKSAAERLGVSRRTYARRRDALLCV